MSMPEHVEVIDVLLVEDDVGDVLLIEEAFADNKVRNRLHTVSDGVEALAFLRREGEHAAAPQPDLVLLDLNLPRKDGREVLAEIKSDEDLRHIPGWGKMLAQPDPKLRPFSGILSRTYGESRPTACAGFLPRTAPSSGGTATSSRSSRSRNGCLRPEGRGRSRAGGAGHAPAPRRRARGRRAVP